MGNVVGPLWADAPAMTRFIAVGYPAVSCSVLALSTMFPDLPMYFTLCLATVVEEKFLWTIIISPLYRSFQGGMSFLMVLFELYMGMQYFPSREKELGSFSFLLWVMLITIVVNMIFLSLMFALSKLYNPQLGLFPCCGLWGIVLVNMTLKSLSDPTGMTNFWGAINIPNKWYPIFLVVIFSLMSGQPLWDLIAALACGYLYPVVKLSKFLPRLTRVNGWERRCCSNPRSCFGATWILVSQTQGYDLESGDRRYATLSDFGRVGQELTRSGTVQPPGGSASGGVPSSFRAFAGSGQRLGDGGDSAPSAGTAPAS